MIEGEPVSVKYLEWCFLVDYLYIVKDLNSVGLTTVGIFTGVGHAN